MVRILARGQGRVKKRRPVYGGELGVDDWAGRTQWTV